MMQQQDQFAVVIRNGDQDEVAWFDGTEQHYIATIEPLKMSNRVIAWVVVEDVDESGVVGATHYQTWSGAVKGAIKQFGHGALPRSSI